MKKLLLPLLSFTFLSVVVTAQQNYFDFEKTDLVTFGNFTGTLDTVFKNLKTNEINSSVSCAKYVREPKVKHDNIRIYTDKKLQNVEKYATHEGFPSKISMKLQTNAPVGTLVEIQLGNKNSSEYPVGVNSQFQAYTSVQNQWEDLIFTFSEIPAGSAVKFNEVDLVTIMFAPNSNDGSTYHFDDFMGPEMDMDLGQSKLNK